MANDQNQLTAGQTIGHYLIVSQLGVGGMGEVYLADDTKLDRKVALKILPADVAADQQRMRRFVQEAKAASALNHPNIVTIHEIDQADSIHFIAVEFIEGETLRQRLTSARMTVREVLDVGIQVASALAAAHKVGIIHRDIKPENIMIRRDGIVKVLDFGLAKLTRHQQTVSVDTQAPTKALIKTEPGVVMGTAQYMSPEQARGIDVDARTDIWSLGCVLYEMATSQQPFSGATSMDVLSAILNREPTLLFHHLLEAPHQLEHIISKAMRKDREERYQTVKDLLIDLKDLKHEIELQAEVERSLPPATVRAMTSERPTVTTSPVQSSAEYIVSRVKLHKRSVLITLAVLILAAATAYYFYFPRSNQAAINSIAILPFVNASNDPNTEYLSDGITESLINSLSHLPNLRMIARSTVFRYKAREIDPQTVGRELRVQAILTGRVVQRGDDLLISAELVDTKDNSHLWGEQYNRKLREVMAVQEEIAQEIAGQLRLKLTDESKKQVVKRYTENTEAYQLYLLGRFHWDKATPEGMWKSIDYYNQALAKDPNYALAYFGLSDAYQLLGQIGFRPNEVYPKALVYAEKALAADPTLPEAHFTRGAYELWYGWNWTVAEQELKRAFEPNTNVAGAHDLYGQFLSGMGRFDEAIAQNKRALELDPLSPLSTSNLGVVYYYARRYDLAVVQNRKAMELEANFFFAPLYIAWADSQQGKYQDAIAELARVRDLPGGFVPATSELGYVHAVSGQRIEAQTILSELQERAKREFIDPYYVAVIYVGLGDQERALTWLNKAYDERSFLLLWLNVEPKFDRLRADPRFQDLVRRVGLPKV